MSQPIPPLSGATALPPSRFGAPDLILRALGVALPLLLAGLPSSLAAQGQGNMQVAAQVLLVEPSRGSLEMGMETLRSGHLAGTGALAAISVTSSPVTPTDADARQPRAVLTIAFVRN